MHTRIHSLIATLLVGAALLVSGCAASSPKIDVLGVADARAYSSEPDRPVLVVFLEVLNPGKVNIDLARFDYRLDAESWFHADGQVTLSRMVSAGSSVVIEVPVRLSEVVADHHGQPTMEAVAYALQGKLIAVSERVERSWDVKVRGVLDPRAITSQNFAPKIRMRVADSH